MQFGIFSVSDITRDPVSGQTPSEAERIDAIVQIAQKAEEVGLDVFAIGEHHNPPFFSSSPTTLLAYIAATTEKLIVTTSTTLITTNDPVRIAEEYAMLQHLSQGPHGPDARPRQHRPGLPVVRPGHQPGPAAGARELQPAAPALARGRRRLGGALPHPAPGLHLDPAAARRRAAVRLARLDPHAGDRRAGRLLRQRLLRQQHLLARGALPAADRVLPRSATRTTATAPRSRRSSAWAARRSSRRTRRTPSASSARTSTRPPSTGTARRWRTSSRRPRWSVGSPQEVIDKTLTFREHFGDYQRQLFLMDHAGPAAEDGARAARPARRRGRAGAAQGDRAPARTRDARRADPRQSWSPPSTATRPRASRARTRTAATT